MECLHKYSVYRTEIFQCSCTARTTHCHSNYNATVITYQTSSFLKMKKSLICCSRVSKTYFCFCWIMSIFAHTHWMNNKIKRGNWFYLLNGEDLEPIVLPWKCCSGHVMELCDECNNSTKFQLYTAKVFRDIPFFVIKFFLHHFVSTSWCHM